MDLKKVTMETALTKRLFAKASQSNIPLSGTFELSPICNFSCKMCYVRKTQEEIKNQDRDPMQLEDWLRLAKEAREQGMLYLLLTGGEPFAWPDFWGLYEGLSDMGFVLSINTNGSLIDASVIEKLRKNPPSRINITLYGASDHTYKDFCNVSGAFSKVDTAIKGLRATGIVVKLNCSLVPQNEHDFEKIVNYAKENELVLSMNTYMFPPIRRDKGSIGVNDRFTPKKTAEYSLRTYHMLYGDEAYEEHLKEIREGYVIPPGLDDCYIDQKESSIRCRAGNAAFWVTWDGWMTPCGMMPEPNVEVKDRPFEKAWQDLVQRSAAVRLSSICEECKNQKICHSCAAMALAETGNTNGIPTYLCQMVNAYREYAEKRIENIN